MPIIINWATECKWNRQQDSRAASTSDNASSMRRPSTAMSPLASVVLSEPPLLGSIFSEGGLSVVALALVAVGFLFSFRRTTAARLLCTRFLGSLQVRRIRRFHQRPVRRERAQSDFDHATDRSLDSPNRPTDNSECNIEYVPDDAEWITGTVVPYPCLYLTG